MPETEPTTPADIEALAVLLEAATPGPWRDVPMGSEGSVVWAGGNTITTARKPATCREFADAALIAAAVNALPALLAEVKASREERARVEALADEWDAADEHGNPLREGSLGEAADELRAVATGRATP